MSNNLLVVADAFHQWRTTRSKRTAVPMHLIQQTLALLETYSKSRIVQQLNISYVMLNRWLGKTSSSTTSAGVHSPAAHVPDEPVPDFIPLPSPTLNASTALALSFTFANGAAFTCQGESTEMATFVSELHTRGVM